MEALKKLQKLLEQRCMLLFWALVALLIALPFLGETPHGQALLSIVNVAVLLTAVAAVGRTRVSFLIAVILVLPALVFRLLAVRSGSPGHFALAYGFNAVFYVFILASLMQYVFRLDLMSRDKLYGAVAAYILIAIFWAQLHGLTQYFYPGAYTLGRRAAISRHNGFDLFQLHGAHDGWIRRHRSCVDSIALPDSSGDGGRRDVCRHPDRAPHRCLSDRGQKIVIRARAWIANYQRDWLAADVAAGLTAAAVVIPKAMAYATIAGLPVEVGLYTAFIAPLVYALLGTSVNLSVTTTTTIAILAAAAIGDAAATNPDTTLLTATATLSVLVGLMLLAARVLRLGFLASFISDPVLAGFKAGIGCVIIVDQLPKVLGVHIDKSGFLYDLYAIFGELPHVSLPTMLVAGATIGCLVLVKKVWPRRPRR